MCLAIPGRIIRIDGNKATIEVSSIEREIYIHLVPEVEVNQYVLVHAGCAIQIVDEEEARITLEILKELAENEIC